LQNLRQNLKLFNYRPLVLIFLGLVGGIFVNHFITRKTAITVVGIVIVLSVLLFYSILHKKFKYFIIVGLAFVVGFGSFGIYMHCRKHKPSDMVEQYSKGVVTNITNRGWYLELLIEDASVDGKQLEYNILLDYYNASQDGYKLVKKGSKIKFKIESQGAPNYYYDNIPHTSNLGNNVGMCATTYSVEILGQKDTIRYSLLSRIRNNLRKGLNNLNGEMIYSAMFGDKTNLNQDLYDAYKGSGVAHLLAVSGLHVGLVSAIIYWILKRLRVNGWARVAIVASLLFCYAYLCNFSYSIMRASIMSLVLMIAPLLFREHDLLNSICFAGIIILLIEPIAIFSLSAQLSFGCVFGIAMLVPIFQKWFSKVPVKASIKDGFCISLATVISTAVFMAYYFKNIQPISLVSNIIILPIFGALFTITFVVAMLSLILPFISFVLILINPLFEWLNWAIICIANIAKPIMVTNVNYLTIILFFVMLAFASKYNLKHGLTKCALVLACISVLSMQVALI